MIKLDKPIFIGHVEINQIGDIIRTKDGFFSTNFWHINYHGSSVNIKQLIKLRTKYVHNGKQTL